MIKNILRYFLALCCLQLMPTLAMGQSETDFSTPRTKMNAFFPEDDSGYKDKLGFSGGWGTELRPYLISSASDLMALAYNVNYEGKTYKGEYFKLTNDIELNPDVLKEDGSFNSERDDNVVVMKWYPIGRYCTFIDDYFAGIFDGDGHTISGLILDRMYDPNEDDVDKMNYVGLFGKIKNATIKNLTLRDCYIQNSPEYKDSWDYNGQQFQVIWRYPQATHYGALVGYAAGSNTIENCHIEQSLFETYSNIRLGGLIGYLEGGSISNCSFNAVVKDQLETSYGESDNLQFGAIVGEVNSGLVEGCKANGTLYFESPQSRSQYNHMNMGGICGYNKGIIKACTTDLTFKLYTSATGHIAYPAIGYGKFRVGGIAGVNKGTIRECAAKGTFYAGQLSNYGTYYYTATLYTSGIANLESGGIIEDCANFTNMKLNNYNFNTEKSTYAGIAQLNLESESEEKAAIRRCTSVCTDMGDNGKSFENQLNYAGIAPPHDELIIDKCYSHNTRTDKTFLDADDSRVTHYPDISDMKAQNPYSSTGIWGIWPETDESDYAGCPLPIAVGGELTELRGKGTAEEPYLIANATELNKMADCINNGDEAYASAYYRLEADITMGSTALHTIGSQAKPFRGTFDGTGHYISNLTTENNYIFDYLFGTVKDLTLLEYHSTATANSFYGIANRLGGEASSDKGLISNCYIQADIHLYRNTSNMNEALQAAGFCYMLNPYGTVENCYLVGNFTFEARTVNGDEPGSGSGIIGSTPTTSVNWGGLVVSGDGGTLNNCYAEMQVSRIGTFNSFQAGGVAYELRAGNQTTLDNCRYICSDINQAVCSNLSSSDLSNTGSVASLDGLAEHFTASPWKTGYFRPVLEGTKCYEATTPEGETTYLDAIPMVPKKNNYFLKVNLSPADFNSDFLQKFQGVAFYAPSQNSDYLLNWTIDPDADWTYAPTEGALVKGRATLTVHRSDSYNQKGWLLLCVPGEVYLNDLPKGSKLCVMGSIHQLPDKYVVNMVEVKSIPAGVPFLLYLPETVSVTSTTNGETTTTQQTVEDVTIVLEGQLATSTRQSDENSELVGSGQFQHMTVTNVCCQIDETTDGETTTRLTVPTESADLKPFAAYIKNNETAEIVDYLLLDEEDPKVEELIAENYEQKIHVKLKRKFKAGQWNTLCLPFYTNPDKVKNLFGDYEYYEYYGYEKNEDGTITIKLNNPYLQFHTWGNPVLIKPEYIRDDDIYDFGEVTIRRKTPYESELYPHYKGIFAPTDLRSTEETLTYFIQGDKIYYVSLNDRVTMRGFRGYLQFSAGDITTETAASQEFILDFAGGTTTRIKPEPTAPLAKTSDTVYDLQGRRLTRPAGKGVYIIGNKKIIK